MPGEGTLNPTQNNFTRITEAKSEAMERWCNHLLLTATSSVFSQHDVRSVVIAIYFCRICGTVSNRGEHLCRVTVAHRGQRWTYARSLLPKLWWLSCCWPCCNCLKYWNCFVDLRVRCTAITSIERCNQCWKDRTQRIKLFHNWFLGFITCVVIDSLPL